MILPNKYTTLTESYIGISALILDVLQDKILTVDKLWSVFNKKYNLSNKIKTPPTYQKFLYVLEFMYMSKMISYNKDGAIKNENFETNN